MLTYKTQQIHFLELQHHVLFMIIDNKTQKTYNNVWEDFFIVSRELFKIAKELFAEGFTILEISKMLEIPERELKIRFEKLKTPLKRKKEKVQNLIEAKTKALNDLAVIDETIKNKFTLEEENLINSEVVTKTKILSNITKIHDEAINLHSKLLFNIVDDYNNKKINAFGITQLLATMGLKVDKILEANNKNQISENSKDITITIGGDAGGVNL